jgi:hypothetical protein
MITAFMDMVGLLMVLPLIPFYAERLGGRGIDVSLLGAGATTSASGRSRRCS